MDSRTIVVRNKLMALPLSTRWFMSIEQTLAKHMHFLANGIESDALIKKYTDFLCQAFVKVPAAHRFTFHSLFVSMLYQQNESILENFYFSFSSV